MEFMFAWAVDNALFILGLVLCITGVFFYIACLRDVVVLKDVLAYRNKEKEKLKKQLEESYEHNRRQDLRFANLKNRYDNLLEVTGIVNNND